VIKTGAPRTAVRLHCFSKQRRKVCAPVLGRDGHAVGKTKAVRRDDETAAELIGRCAPAGEPAAPDVAGRHRDHDDAMTGSTIRDELKYGAMSLLAPSSTAMTDIPAANSVRYKKYLLRMRLFSMQNLPVAAI